MGRGRKTLGGAGRIRGEGFAAGVSGQERIGKIAPKEGGEVLQACVINRETGQNGEASLARKIAKALRIAGATEAAIPIHIKARGPARIGALGESMRVGRDSLGEQIGKGAQGGEFCVIVNIREHEDIGIDARDHIAGGQHLRFLAPDVAQEEARAFAGETRAKKGNAQVLGQKWCAPCEGEQKRQNG